MKEDTKDNIFRGLIWSFIFLALLGCPLAFTNQTLTGLIATALFCSAILCMATAIILGILWDHQIEKKRRETQ